MNFYRRKRRMPAVIIVSLIDIFAILLIFVIVTTTFKAAQPAVVIRLPESRSTVEAPSSDNPAVLWIDKSSKIFLDEKPVTESDLKAAVQEMLSVTPGRQLALRADTDTPFGLIIRVLDLLKESGIKNLPAFTEIPEE